MKYTAPIVIEGDTFIIAYAVKDGLTDSSTAGFSYTAYDHVHSWNADYTVDREAGCTESGLKSIHCTGCTETKDATEIPPVGHTYHNGQCTVCGEVQATDKPEESKGLSIGAIIAIVLASIALAGIGGFAIYWFVIKKKRFSELGATMKTLFGSMKNKFKKK